MFVFFFCVKTRHLQVYICCICFAPTFALYMYIFLYYLKVLLAENSRCFLSKFLQAQFAHLAQDPRDLVSMNAAMAACARATCWDKALYLGCTSTISRFFFLFLRARNMG